jgi:type II secretory pathway pseudopilin PulG
MMSRLCSSRRAAFTIIEMLTTVAVLIIVFGLMVNLAKTVRKTSSIDQTNDLLRQMDEAMSLYLQRSGGHLPALPDFVPPAKPTTEVSDAPVRLDETGLPAAALSNNEAVVRLFKASKVFPAERFESLSTAYYNGYAVRDAWGSPIVFMPRLHPAIGQATKGWFFFSAGPDRQYTTKLDNLYSYDLPGLDQAAEPGDSDNMTR